MWLSALIFVAFCGTIVLLLATKHLLRAALAVVVYAALLAASGAASKGGELARGYEKHICEIDCHLAYSVLADKRVGETYDVVMRVRFDESTIGPQRGDGLNYPGPRRVLLLDTNGHKYRPLSASGIDKPLRPGEAMTLTIRFVLPENARPELLRFEDADPSKRLLLGSETAPLHKRTTFKLT